MTENEYPEVHMHSQLLVPTFNELYDSLRTTKAWRYLSDNYASGTIATTAGSAVLTAVSLGTTAKQYRLSQWPDGIQVYLAIRFFGIAPQVVPATVGNIECLFIDNSGNTTPLGEFMSNSGGNLHPTAIIPKSITDPGETSVGKLSVQLSSSSSTATYNWSFGFSYVYLLPAEKGFKIHDKNVVYNGH